MGKTIDFLLQHLKLVYCGMAIEEFHPDEMALEAPFYGKNMLKLGRTQGVAVCHHFQKGSQQRANASWKSFVADNPGRVK